MKINFTFIPSFLAIIFLLLVTADVKSQTQRNPVLEECTGTWCQWCPCGHDIIESITQSMPNAVVLCYHGPANTASDPWSTFQGNDIISMLSMSSYPTGVIDRTGPPQSRTAWAGLMAGRLSVPATVSINLQRSYNRITRELNATVNVTALVDLTGDYKMNLVLLENGLVYPQTGNGSCPGASDYVHDHVVRAIINGATGDVLNSSAPWPTGTVHSKTLQYSVPAGINPDSCDLAVLVYKVASPFYNSEIQQAEKYTLIAPDYVATITSTSPDVMGTSTTPVQFTTVLHNEGLMNDVYDINPVLSAPAGWTGEYTTVNGTFPFGTVDTVAIASGDSTEITVTVNPNSVDGFGLTTLTYTSRTEPGTTGSIIFRNVTTSGVEVLVVDASGEGYGDLVFNSLERVYSGTYGIISKDAVAPFGDLTGFDMIIWSAGIAAPVFSTDEVAMLEEFLDQNGQLFINGQNIGADIFGASGQSQHAQSFYNEYLNATFINDVGTSFLLQGYTGDPISDGLLFILGDVYAKSPDQIAEYDTDASPLFKFGNGPNIGAIKASTEDFRVVYCGFGIEQISDAAVRDSLISRSMMWLKDGIVSDVIDENQIPQAYSLDQNYPNPFNPATVIKYQVPATGNVVLKVYDVLGKEVASIVNENQNAGYYTVSFDASNLSSGVYFYTLTSGEFTSTKKMTLVK